ncbi:MAG: hypothetical protein GY848_05995 [Methyloversatilis sp.]|nr:hypothetical protein [Methyloversatilis sp.]
MDAQHATRLIDAAGSDQAFAEALGLQLTPGVRQRVNNWKRRGIPAHVQLRYAKELSALDEKAARDTCADEQAGADEKAA